MSEGPKKSFEEFQQICLPIQSFSRSIQRVVNDFEENCKLTTKAYRKFHKVTHRGIRYQKP